MIRPVDAVVLSQNEIESLCLKAARGAGYAWGLAEEAGFAAGWLAARGIDGTAPLLGLLTRRQGQRANRGTPRPTPGHWRSTDEPPLCPIMLGAALLDSALLPDGPFSRITRVDTVSAPILLLPFLARAAQICAKSLVIGWQGRYLLINANGDFDRMAATSWMEQKELALTIRTASEPVTLPVGHSRLPARLPEISFVVLDGLDALALRTTVPATEASRHGAGSATSDND